uniref:Uncharacterized protein n=1 Tax=Plectus sambesii TaxID=2011161 RepID=A0A914VMJ6_9BILA
MKPSRQQNGEVKREERERIRQNGKFGRSKQPIVPFVGESAPEQVIKFNFTREEMMTKEEIEKLKVVDCLRDRLLPTEREVADDTIQVTGKHADLLVLSAPYPNSDDEDAVRPADSEYIMADIVGNFNKLSLDTRSLFSMRHSTQIRPQEGLSKERYIQWRINQYKEKRSDIRDAMENHSLSLIPINYHSHGPYETTALSLRPFVGAATAFRQRSDPATECNLHDHSVQICSHSYDYRRVHSILPKTYHRILPEYLINCPCLRMSYGADCDCQQLVEVATYKLHNVMLKIAGGVPPDMSLFEKTTGLETNVDEIVQQGTVLMQSLGLCVMIKSAIKDEKRYFTYVL